jgi:hypothetical protein
VANGNGRLETLKVIGTWLMWLTTVGVLLLHGAGDAGVLAARVEAQATRIERLEQVAQNVATKDDVASLRHLIERVEDRLERAGARPK